jgi:hypothetical protein
MRHCHQLAWTLREQVFASIPKRFFLGSAEDLWGAKEHVLNGLVAKHFNVTIKFGIYRSVVPRLEFVIDQPLAGSAKMNHVGEIEDLLKRKICHAPVTIRAYVARGRIGGDGHGLFPTASALGTT